MTTSRPADAPCGAPAPHGCRAPAAQEPAGLYVHVPFCSSKCPYCGFSSIVDRTRADDWLEALAQEAGSYARSFPSFDSLYVGGGTPSCLGAEALTRLLGTLQASFELLPGAEITIEVNPGDASPGLLRLLRELGVSRLSLGVQSLDDRVLRVLGRRHDAAQALDSVRSARDAGFATIGVDLIYGVPGQSQASWLGTLERVVGLGPEHLSCYMLTREAGTPFAEAVAAGRVRACGEEVLAQRFRETSARLRSAGYLHYEVSNFSRGSEHRARHNGKYWRHVPYLGLGPAAHSFSGQERWWNLSSVDEYLGALAAGRAPVAGRETLTAAELELEALALGLRTSDGIPSALVRGATSQLEALSARGWLRRDEERWVPTPEGLLFADRMALELSLALDPDGSPCVAPFPPS
jgi:putative oxygen-independent coproporphyrinogen III oxidase